MPLCAALHRRCGTANAKSNSECDLPPAALRTVLRTQLLQRIDNTIRVAIGNEAALRFPNVEHVRQCLFDALLAEP